MGRSKRKPYYGLKRSIAEFFREPVRYLKESNRKESVFEKPYQVGEYPKMHFNFPSPNWPYGGIPARRIPSLLGMGDRGKIHTIIFADPSCHPGVANLGCGDSDSLFFSIWSTPPAELGAKWTWEVFKVAGTPETLVDEVEMSSPVVSGERGDKVRVTLSALDVAETGTLVVCAKAVWVGGAGLKAITVDVPEGTNPFFAGDQALGRPHQFAPIRPSRELARSTVTNLFCCQDVAVEGCCSGVVTAYDYVNSAATIAREADATVYVTGTGSNITWDITGVGFSIVGNGLSATVSADNTACGAGSICKYSNRRDKMYHGKLGFTIMELSYSRSLDKQTFNLWF